MVTALKIQKISSKTSEILLNSDNYYSNESDWEYQSKTWFTKFINCEAEALAELKVDWEPNGSLTPLLVGNYLHSYFESSEAHQAFLDEHPEELFKYGNPEKGLKSDFIKANKMITALDEDEKFRALYQGNKEVPVEGELFGVQWKGKIDCLDLDRHIFLDLKTVDDIHKKHWSEEQHAYVSFAEARGYDMQMAIYQELIKQTFGVVCVPYIIAVSKQDIPDKAVLSIPDYLMDYRMKEIDEKQPRIEAVKNGQEKPKRCEHCDYCRATKQLESITSIDNIEFY